MKKAFTLIELLAVIVILAIILAIAIPSINNLVDNSTKNTFESNAKMVLNAIRLKLLEDNTFDPTSVTEENIKTFLNIDDTNYKEIKVTEENGSLGILIVGQNKWDDLIVSSSQNDSVVYKGIVLWLDASDSRSYSGEGNIWYDLSGNNNNCNWNNIPAYNSEGYFTFDGVSNYGTIINNASLNFSEYQTLIMVLRHTYTVGRKNPWNQAYGGYGTWTHEQGNSISQYFGNSGVNGSPYVGIASSVTPRSVWNVVAATRSPIEHKWYLNGDLTKTTINPYGTLTTTAANILIGRGYAGYWQGDMAAVFAFNRVLSGDEIKQNYETSKIIN